MRTRLTSETGFSVVELLVTMVILTILATMMIPLMKSQSDQTREPTPETVKTTTVGPADQ